MSVRANRAGESRRIGAAVVAAWPAWLVAAACFSVALAGDGAYALLKYSRSAILDGQWWRIASGNFVHLGVDHLLMDQAGLALLWVLCAPVLGGWRWLAATATGTLAVGFGLLVFSPLVGWYVGISGVLHTYWAAGAILLVSAGHREGWLMIAGLIVKLIWEQSVGPMPFSESMAGGSVVVDAHLWGALGGVLMAIPMLLGRFSGKR